MSIIDQIRARIAKKSEKTGTKVSELPREKRLEIEDLYDNSWTAKEISAETGIDLETIYKVKEQLMRKRGTILRNLDQNSSFLGEKSPVETQKEALEEAKFQLAVDRINFEREKLQKEREELIDDDEPDVPQGSNIEDSLMQMFMMNMMQKNNPQPHYTNPTVSQPITQPQTIQTTLPVDNMTRRLNDQQIGALIKRMPRPYIKLIKEGTINREEAITRAREELPTLTEADAARGYEMVMKK